MCNANPSQISRKLIDGMNSEFLSGPIGFVVTTNRTFINDSYFLFLLQATFSHNYITDIADNVPPDPLVVDLLQSFVPSFSRQVIVRRAHNFTVYHVVHPLGHVFNHFKYSGLLVSLGKTCDSVIQPCNVKPCVISSNSFASGYLSPQALLTTSVGGCCYSREVPVAKQKENRRRKIHAVRTHPKNDMKTATAKKLTSLK